MILKVLLMHCMRLEAFTAKQFGSAAVMMVVTVRVVLSEARRLYKMEGAE